MLRVRRLTVADAGAYRALRLRGLKEHPEAFTSDWEEDERLPVSHAEKRLKADPLRPHDGFWGAWLGTEMVGVVGLQGRYRQKERHNATVVGMYVPAEHARHGAGTALMASLLQYAWSLPALRQLDLTVTVGNGCAQRLYERFGFGVVGELPQAIGVAGRFYNKRILVLARPADHSGRNSL